MKYASSQGWTIHAYADGHIAWWLGAASGEMRVMPPGTVGWNPAPGGGAFTNFDDCVAANLLVAPVVFDYAGGPLGVWLKDSPVEDNVAGPDGRNPSWTLSRVDGCDAGVD